MRPLPDALIGDSLFQTNLVLWMLQPSGGPPVRPVLRDAGFSLRAIEPTLGLPIPLAGQLQARGIAFADPVSPDVMLQDANQGLVLVECKRSLFGSSLADQCGSAQKQARSILLQTPANVASALGLTLKNVADTRVIYITCRLHYDDQGGGLTCLSQSLKRAGLDIAPVGLLPPRREAWHWAASDRATGMTQFAQPNDWLESTRHPRWLPECAAKGHARPIPT